MWSAKLELSAAEDTLDKLRPQFVKESELKGVFKQCEIKLELETSSS